MKFLEKMKNLFTEEVEEVVEEKPIKKEVKQPPRHVNIANNSDQVNMIVDLFDGKIIN